MYGSNEGIKGWMEGRIYTKRSRRENDTDKKRQRVHRRPGRPNRGRGGLDERKEVWMGVCGIILYRPLAFTAALLCTTISTAIATSITRSPLRSRNFFFVKVKKHCESSLLPEASSELTTASSFKQKPFKVDTADHHTRPVPVQRDTWTVHRASISRYKLALMFVAFAVQVESRVYRRSTAPCAHRERRAMVELQQQGTGQSFLSETIVEPAHCFRGGKFRRPTPGEQCTVGCLYVYAVSQDETASNKSRHRSAFYWIGAVSQLIFNVCENRILNSLRACSTGNGVLACWMKAVWC